MRGPLSEEEERLVREAMRLRRTEVEEEEEELD